MSGIEHVVVLMLENRSFDEYFGTFPGASGFSDDTPSVKQPWPGQQSGFLYPWRLSTFTTNALHPPALTHDWITNHVAINVDAAGTPSNTGFYISSVQDPLVMGCYLADDIPYFWALAQAFALCDHYFCSALAGTIPNRMFLSGGSIADPAPGLLPASGIYQGGQDNTPPVTQYNGTDPILYNPNVQPGQNLGFANVPMVPLMTELPQWGSYLADLQDRSPGGSQYRVYDDWNWQFVWATSPGPSPVSDLNAFSYYRPYQTASGGPITLGTPDDPSYFAANYTPNAAGKLGDSRPLFAQHVSPAKPAFPIDRKQPEPFLAPLTWILPPLNYSDHPQFTSADASYYVAQIVDALMESPFWESTALIITYDESNNAFDHVPPPLSPNPRQVVGGQLPFEPWVTDVGGTPDDLNAPGGPSVINYPAPIGAGMRVPTIIVSPWTYQRGVVSVPLDHSSILQLMETVSGVACSGLPAATANLPHLNWRRENFANLYQVIDAENSPVIPAGQITVPHTATVYQWQQNANARYMRPSATPPAAPATQASWPAAQACQLMLTPDFYEGASVLAEAAGQPAVTIPGAVTVIVTGFQAQEFVEPHAGVPPLGANLTEVPVAGGAGTCLTRVPVPRVVNGASPGEISIGSCSQVSIDPNLSTGQQDPLPFIFTFPLTFNYPDVSFAFRKGTTRVLDVQAVFTVDATVTEVAQLTLAGGTATLPDPEACQRLAEQIGQAAEAVDAASHAQPGPDYAAQLHAAEVALAKLQKQYAEECGPGIPPPPTGPLPPGAR